MYIFLLIYREPRHPILVDRSLVEWGICKLCWIPWRWGSTTSASTIRAVYHKWYARCFPDRCSRHLASDLNPRETPRWNQWNIWPHFVRQRWVLTLLLYNENILRKTKRQFLLIQIITLWYFFFTGASIIRMMNHYLTENSFRGGLSNYLTEL